MTLRSTLNGTFTLAELDRLAFPVAWDGTKDKDEAHAEESELRDLVRNARNQLEELYTHQGDGETDYEIVIKDGEIVGFEES